MSLLRVTQSLTADGKVQIDVSNTSGLPQNQANPLPPSTTTRHHNVRDIPEGEEPRSLIVSLRSSHPQFFYYRGLQQKQLPSTSVASPLHAPPPGSAGCGAIRGDSNTHLRSTLSIWNFEDADPVIEDVSRQTWKDLGFLPVAAPTAGAQKSSAAAAAADSSVSNRNPSRSEGHDRPLLVREELADCILFPGERRTFLLEVDTPSVLRRLVAPLVHERRQVASAAPSRQLNCTPRASCPSCSHQHAPAQSTDSTTTVDGTGILHIGRVVTKGFLTEVHDIDGASKRCPAPSPRIASTAEETIMATCGDGRHQQVSNVRGKDPLQVYSSSRRHTDSDKRTHTRAGQISKMQHTPSKGALPLDASNNKGNHRKGGGTAAQTPSENDPRSRQTDWEPDLSYTENIDESSHLRERLSIVKESSSTRRSPDIASRAAPIDSVLTSVNSTEASTPLAVNAYRAGVGATHTPCESDVDAAAELASGNEPRTQKWPSPAPVSQRPTFYIYYAALGDENKCVEQARKWLLKEQHAYQLWLDNTVRTVVELQRKCEQEWTRRSNNSVQSMHHRPLGARRVLPPTLGELVRWRTDGGGSDAVSDVMTRSPITAAAFQYYYGNILLDNGMRRSMPHMSGGSNGTSDLGAGGASSNAGGFRNKGAVLVLPPSFASTRRNRVSKKARKMFKEERNGAGTVVLPFRVVQRQLPTQPPYTTASSSGASGAPLANPRYASMSALSQPPEPPTPQHQQQSWHTRPCNVPTSPRPYTMNKFMDMEEKCGCSSRVNERRLAEPGNERFGFKAGSGMALLEESLTSSPTPTHTSLAGVVTTTMPPQKDSTKALLNLQQRFLSDNIRVNRTETLDPATAELAAMTLSPTHWSSFHDMSCQEQPRHPESPQQSQPLPPSTSPVDEVASPDSVTWNSGSTGPNPLGSASQKLEWVQLSNRSNPSSRLYGLLTNADDSPSAATTMGLSDSTNNNGGRVTITDNAPPPGTSIDGLATPNTLTSSLAAQPLQPFYGSSGSAKVEVEDEGHSSAHRRDISSAPPQTLAYRRRANGSSNINSPSPSTNITAGSFSMNPQEGLNWIADHSKVAGFQVRVAARLFTTTAGVVCATAVGLVQQHGPPAMSALARLSNILRDTVFTSENVRIMQTVLTPMIMFCSVVVIVYLILGGEGDDEVFSLIENKGLL